MAEPLNLELLLPTIKFSFRRQKFGRTCESLRHETSPHSPSQLQQIIPYKNGTERKKRKQIFKKKKHKRRNIAGKINTSYILPLYYGAFYKT